MTERDKLLPSERSPIAVVGVSALFPGSVDATGFWRDILAGTDLLTDVPESHWLAEDYYDPDPAAPDKSLSRRGAFLPPVGFDCMEWGVPPSNVPATDTSQLLALIVARKVLEDATGGDFASVDRSRVSVILGVTTAQELLGSMVSRLQRPVWVKALRESGIGEDEVEAICDRIAAHYPQWQESTFPGALGNVVAGRIANRLDLGGTNCVTDAACASSFSALEMALQELELGDSDMVITGGVDTMNDIIMYMCFSKTHAMSPSDDCRPFSDKADGTILGEGLGMLALMRLADAERQKRRVYAVIKGLGASSDGRATSVYAPVPEGQARALRRAYANAGFGPEHIELVEAHGTGTRAGDQAEFKGLRQVYDGADRPDRPWCALGSVKSQIGHTKAAAGAAGLFKAVMALHHKVLPPTIKIERPDPGLALEGSPFYFNTRARPWVHDRAQPRRAAVSSFGFGGSNFHVAVEEYRGQERAPRLRSQRSELVVLGADDSASLARRCREVADGLLAGDLAFLAWSAAREGEVGRRHRLCLRASSEQDLGSALRLAAERLEAEPDRAFDLPGGIHYGCGSSDGELALLFPGQGSQYLDMGAELAMHFDAAREVWDGFAGSMLDGSSPIHRLVFPQPVFEEAERQAQQDRLRATEWAQPAICCASLATLALLEQLGLNPSCAAGHSLGELCALHAASAMQAEDLLRVARRRGELMAQAALQAREPGGMTAVAGSAERVRELLARRGGRLVLANHNSPRQVVVSGPLAELEELEAALGAEGLVCKRLDVACAFHSPLVSEAAEPFGRFLSGIDFGACRMPVYANSTAEPYPDDARGMRELLAMQVARPVRFVEMIRAMHARGVRTFVELGPGQVLTRLVQRILAGEPHRAVSLDRKDGGLDAFLDGIGQLAAAGCELDLRALWRGYRAPLDPRQRSEARLAVEICGSNRGKLYPPPEGRAGIPPPNPPRERRPAEKPPREAAPLEAPPAVAGFDPDWLQAFQDAQRQTAEAHVAYQRAMAQAHSAYLQSVALTPRPPLPETVDNRQIIEKDLCNTAERRGMQVEKLRFSTVSEGEGGYLAAGVTGLAQDAFAAGMSKGAAAAMGPGSASLPSAAVVAEGLPSAAGGQDLMRVMLEVVADKTGYPVEMIELGMDLEGDLGIDSIKRVEILSEVRERAPGLPELDAKRMAGLRTLGEIADFLGRQLGLAAPRAPQASGGLDPERLHEIMLAVVADKTGYPVEMIDLGMDLEGDLGIDSIKRVEILSEVRERAPGLPELDAKRMAGLRTLGEIADFLRAQLAGHGSRGGAGAQRGGEPGAAPETAGGDAQPPAREGSGELGAFALEAVAAPPSGMAMPGLLEGGRVCVSAVEPELAAALVAELTGRGVRAEHTEDAADLPPDAIGLVLLSGLAEVETIDAALAIQRDAFRAARAAARTPIAASGLLAIVQDTGGCFGLRELPPERAWLAGLAGLAKTAGQEWPGCSVKAVDLERASRPAAELARRLADELLAGGPEREVGLGADGTRWTLRLKPTEAAGQEPAPVERDAVWLVSGGGRGVTAACLRELAGRWKGRLRIALLGRTPLEDEPACCRGERDDAGLKRALLQRAREQGRQPSPSELGREAERILRVREIRANLEALQRAGAEPRYVRADVTDAAEVDRAVRELRADWGPPSALVHAAGVIADKPIADKAPEQFDRVFDTKVRGLQALLEATRGDPLELVCLFSSVAARTGNPGQADYAMANEVLNKVARAERARRGRACRVCSLGWGPWAGGMVSAGLARHFAELGVELIELEAGARFFARAAAGPEPASEELVVAPLATLHGFAAAEREVELDLHVDQGSHPYLRSHRIQAQPVLPMAIVLEWFARAARAQRPDLSLERIEDLKVLRGVQLAGFESQGDRLRVCCRPLADGQGASFGLELRDADGRVRYSARAEMVPDRPAAPRASLPGLDLEDWGAEPVYGGVLFHGPDFQVIRSLEGISAQGIAGELAGVRSQSAWAQEAWRTDAAAFDGGLQLALLWSRRVLGADSLPTGIREVRTWTDGPADGPVRCVLQGKQTRSDRTGSDLVFVDREGRLLAEFRGVETHLLPSGHKD